MEDLTGRQFGPYRIVAPLGEGGMAAVYKAFQPSMERYVAIKVLPRHLAASPEFVARFNREAKLLAQLQHPNILPVFDYGEAEGFTYIVMPFVQSGTLGDAMRKQRFSLPEVRDIMVQLGRALGYAHARGMIHRDIKPSNVLMDETNNCLLTDFGLARMTEVTSALTASGSIMGTPAYMSPEQGTGENLDGRSDIYSLGIIFYELVTGRVPFTAETPIAIIYKHLQDPLPLPRSLNPGLPEDAERVLLRALAKSREDRYQTADEFVRAVQRALPETELAEKTLLTDASGAAATLLAGQTASAGDTSGDVRTVSAPRGETRKLRPVAETGKEKATAPAPSSRLPVWILVGAGALALVLIVAFVALNAGNKGAATLPPTSAANPVVGVNPPTNTPRPLPTSTPLTEVPAGIIFRDDFETQLAEGWAWEAEDPAKWSLSEVPGSLLITATDASLDGPGLPANLLLRDAPVGDFEITTLLRFEPASNFQFAGLLIFQDQGNALQFGRAYCDVGGACVGDGLYFDYIENSAFVGDSFKTPFSGRAVYLRVRRQGNAYTAYYSEDGETWTTTGQQIKELSPVRVGLVAAQAPEEISATFDYFIISEPSDATP